MIFLSNKLNIQRTILVFFYLICAVIGYIYLFDFGIHIEEKFHRLNGHYWLNFLANKFSLTNLASVTNLKIIEIGDYTLNPVSLYNKYGVILDLPAAFLEDFFNINEIKNVYYLKHYLSFLIFLFSSYFFYKILQNRFNNFFLNFAGLILFITSPRILGDSFLYKDVLFLSLFNMSLYFLLESLNNLNRKNLILFSLFASWAITLRIYGLFLPMLFIFILILQLSEKKNFLTLMKKIFFIIFFLCLFTYLFWPYLWENPIINFISIFLTMKKSLVDIKILYANEFINNYYLPPTYILNWIFISNPILQSFFFVLGFSYCFRRVISRYFKIEKKLIYNDLWRSKKELKDFSLLLILFSYFFVFLFINAPFYNGWRLVFFYNIFIIYFIIYFFNIFALFLRNNDGMRRLLNIVLILTIFINIHSIVKFHPFQSLFFNNFLSEEKKNSYEGDYHGLAAKHFFNKILQTENNGKIIKVAVASHTPLHRGLESLSQEKRDKFLVVGQEYSSADYIFKNNISEVNSNLIKKYEIPQNFSKVFSFEKNNVIIYEVYKANNKIK